MGKVLDLWSRLPPLNEGYEAYTVLLVRTDEPRRIWDTFFIKTNNKNEVLTKVTYAYRKAVGLKAEMLLDVTPKSINLGIEKFIRWYMEQKLNRGSFIKFTAELSTCIRKSDINAKKLYVYVSNEYIDKYSDIAVIKYDNKYYHITSKKVSKDEKEVPLPGFVYDRGMAELMK
ncbi:MAG: hypothetical protein QXS74_06290 [Nitrososphaeria archaeon]